MEVDTKPNPKAKAKPGVESSIQTTDDVTTFVKNLLCKMNDNFERLAAGILSRIDDLGKRIDEMEDSLNAIKAEAATQTPVKPNSDEPKPENEEPKPEAEEPKIEADDFKPKADEAEPKFDEPLPDSDEPMPDSGELKPEADEVKPESDEPIPNSDELMPESDELKADPKSA